MLADKHTHMVIVEMHKRIVPEWKKRGLQTVMSTSQSVKLHMGVATTNAPAAPLEPAAQEGSAVEETVRRARRPSGAERSTISRIR